MTEIILIITDGDMSCLVMALIITDGDMFCLVMALFLTGGDMSSLVMAFIITDEMSCLVMALSAIWGIGLADRYEGTTVLQNVNGK